MRREGSREYYAEDRDDAALARTIEVIGGWRRPTLDMEPEAFEDCLRSTAVAGWIERHWPKDEDALACRHCRARYKPEDHNTLIPVGYGPRPKVWVHRECYDPYWAGVRLRALKATGFDYGTQTE
jgi:hypothetical protein